MYCREDPPSLVGRAAETKDPRLGLRTKLGLAQTDSGFAHTRRVPRLRSLELITMSTSHDNFGQGLKCPYAVVARCVGSRFKEMGKRCRLHHADHAEDGPVVLYHAIPWRFGWEQPRERICHTFKIGISAVIGKFEITLSVIEFC